MSTYVESSELSRFNRAAASEPFSLSSDTFDVFQLSQQISEQTGGAFDITVGPLVNAWGFGPEGPGEMLSDKELSRLRKTVGYRRLTLDPVAKTVTKDNAKVYCDLSAVAKGYAVDRVALALDDLAIANYMVEIGGEVRTSGVNADGVPWQIGIEVPTESASGVQTVISLENMALATSGDYRNFYEKDGVRVSHTIDPSTGRPVQHSAASVSVVHHECAYADAFATALMVMGPDKGLAFADEIGLPVLFLVHGDNGAIKERPSSAYTKFYGP
jgi:thiamine biosynthesis lipoprotein